jgi:hypothetical protein
MQDGDPSLLAQYQREFLQMETDGKETEYERQTREKIRSRVREGIRDMRLLVRASANEDIDLSQIMSPNKNKTPAEKHRGGDAEAPPAWPLAALLFAWTDGHRVTPTSLFSDEEPTGPESEIEQRARMFDLQVQQGVEKSLVIEGEQVVNDVNNTLTVSTVPEISEMPNEDLAAMPPHIPEQLFQAGHITGERLQDISSKRFELVEKGEVDPRPPVGNVSHDDIGSFSDLETYLDQAVRERETGTEDN